ncbi:pyridoxamine 5'-phosphate oxidase family protein [Nocardia carnea]|uniref:Pyridoxamine 5'-phosphate oxidase family protein n=1 Tax=Nocardia carnea TaxID=37328 RepID=A0ABW7TTE0_9NOCA|nr:pyridoxamine 5'-phosphate oxidase family protein [Nocardia carnea]
MEHFFALTFGAEEQAHQRRKGSLDRYEHALSAAPVPTGLGAAEAEFLQHRDSFYIASTGSNGWPYVQHRGGPAGFVKVTGPTQLAWVESTGNRQYITAGHLDHDDRVAIIAVDYPNRKRLKILGHARFDPEPAPDTLEPLRATGRIEGVLTVEVVAFDWNCPKYITPRFTVDEMRAATEPLRERISQLETALAAQQAATGLPPAS